MSLHGTVCMLFLTVDVDVGVHWYGQSKAYWCLLAYWTLFTCLESTEIRDLDSTGREFFNAFEATWTTALCCLQSWRQTGIPSVRPLYLSKHILFSGPSFIDTCAFAGRNLPDFQSPSSHHCIQAIKPKSETAREACIPGGASGALFFSNGLVQVLQNVAICFKDREWSEALLFLLPELHLSAQFASGDGQALVHDLLDNLLRKLMATGPQA